MGAVLALIALIGYPAPRAQTALYWGALTLLIGCAALAWFGGGAAALRQPATRRLIIGFGVGIGACWIIEMVVANLVPVPTSAHRFAYFAYLVAYEGPTLIAFALPVVGGFVTTRLTRRLSDGIAVSFWVGLLSGLIGYLTLMFLTYTCLGVIEHDPQTLSQFAQSHRQQPTLTLSAFIVGDSLFGSVSHLLLIGAGWGSLLGALGAVLGRLPIRGQRGAPVP